jgi:small conductance mechanosensitive channel
MKTKSLKVSFNKLNDKLEGWLDKFNEMIPNVIIALLVFLVFYISSKWIGRLISKMLEKFSDNKLINKIIVSALSITIIFAGIFFALGLMHLNKTVSSLLAGIGILGLALSFAFQHTAANVLAGFIISLRSSVHLGYLIESNGVFGNIF